MYNKQEVLASLDKDVWSPIAMAAVIASQAMKLSEKGQSLNMYALDLSPRDGVDEKMNQQHLDAFVDGVYKTAMTQETPIRMQLAVRTSSVHWTAVALEITKNGVQFLQVDAVGDPSSGIISKMFQNLANKYPNFNQSKFYFLRHAEIPGGELKQC